MGQRRRGEWRQDQAGDGRDARNQAGGGGPAPEVGLERRAFRFDREVCGRQVRAYRDREQADQHAIRRGPTGLEPRYELPARDADGTRRNRRRPGGHEEGRDDAGGSERHTPPRRIANGFSAMRPEGKCRPAKHDSEERDGER